jgi:hypothetical protein
MVRIKGEDGVTFPVRKALPFRNGDIRASDEEGG